MGNTYNVVGGETAVLTRGALMPEHREVWRSVAIEIDGRSVLGTYRVGGNVVTVSYQQRSKTAQLAGSGAEAVAEELLGELARESNRT